ncbi:sperm-associated antigen 1 isoform X2 [Paralichthys olivaceus]|uniref:sperm-associated antigen 1 isoform X2 n=1 Tax=Paralichthys olivaceus TaxID=8255 RepID=UPI00375223C9
MSADAVLSLQNQSTSVDYSVHVEHLDYNYIEECKNVKYVEKILKVLRSGQEGIYPHLIEFCESHLEKLDPKSPALRKENSVATAASLLKDEWSQIVEDMKTWQEETKRNETSLKQQAVFDLGKNNIPPIRGSHCSILLCETSNAEEKRNPSKCTLPRDYREWDKFDVERECERIDGNVVNKNIPSAKGHSKIKTKVDASFLTQPEKLLLANREKDKGNEAFRAKDYEEAVVYYSRSLSILPTVAAYNNKAQAEINLKHWYDAMSDCQRVLELEPGNVKALLRRATVHKHMGQFELAVEDLRMVLMEEPQNPTATKLLSETEKLKERQPEQQRKGKKILIQEVEEKDENSNDDTKAEWIDSPEDLCILYSNRAACYLKDGNSQDCIQDCTRALELQPFFLKPLLRRAMAYESLERYRQAYVDYKTVLQIDISVQAAHDSANRITRLLIDQDGPEWREKLPEIPLVPLSAQQHRREEPPSAEVLQARAEKAARDTERKAEIRFTVLKQEGNDFVKKVQYQDALGKYSECLKLKPEECAVYTNRALCYLKLERFTEAKQDCDAALKLEPTNKKAFYRRALANKGLKDYLACTSDLQEVLQQDPNLQEAERELEEVTVLLRQSLALDSQAKSRKTVPITEVEGDEEVTSIPTSEGSCRGEDISINIHPTNVYEFGQALNAARCSGNTAACADLLTSTAPQMLPEYLSTQLDGHTISFIIQVLDSHLLEKDPSLVFQHLNHLHTTDRFSIVLMLLEKDERHHITHLFEHLSAIESTDFTKNDVQNLANKYI